MATSDVKLEIIERDEAGNVVATYVQSGSPSANSRGGEKAASTSSSRIDIIVRDDLMTQSDSSTARDY